MTNWAFFFGGLILTAASRENERRAGGVERERAGAQSPLVTEVTWKPSVHVCGDVAGVCRGHAIICRLFVWGGWVERWKRAFRVTA